MRGRLIVFCLLSLTAASGAHAELSSLRLGVGSTLYSGRDFDEHVKSLCGIQSRHQMSGEQHMLRLGYQFLPQLAGYLLAGEEHLTIMDRLDSPRSFAPVFGVAVEASVPLAPAWSVRGSVRHQRSSPPDYVTPSGIRGINTFTYKHQETSARICLEREAGGLTAYAGAAYIATALAVKMTNSTCGTCVKIDHTLRGSRPWHGVAGLAWPLTANLRGSTEFSFGGESNVNFRLDYQP